MNARLAALLQRYADDPRARQELKRLRCGRMPADACLQVATRLAALGQARAAALWLFAARRQRPNDANTVYRLANALRTAGRTRAAAAILERLAREHPAWGEPAQSLAWLHRNDGRPEPAAAALERWAEATDYSPRVVLATSAFLQDIGLAERAGRLMAKTPLERADARFLFEYGDLLLKLGRFEEAERVLRAAARPPAGEAAACVRLAYVRRWTPAANPAADLSAQLNRPGLDSGMRAATLFALAKVYDDLGRYAEAFAAAERANALRASASRFDRALWRTFEKGIYEAFTPEFVASAAGYSGSSERPVFIVGMPRSGTTLLEQRLARHPALTGAGELESIEALARELTANEGYPSALPKADPQRFRRASISWRERLPAALAAKRGIVDKNPLNFLHVGLIALLFPASGIVHIHRDPLDTALSIYLQGFSHPKNDFAYRMDDIAWMFALYRRVMTFWLQLFPGRIYTVRYERLVEEPERELRRLLNYLQLQWEPACMLGAAGPGAISTASVWQARQPIYSHAVGRARHYEPWLAGLRAALAKEAAPAAG